MTVVYDGNCALCRRAVRALVHAVGSRRLTAVDGGAVTRERYGVDATDAMYLVADGTLYRGYWAFARAFAASPALRPLALLMALGPVAALGERAYGWIAANRASLSCARPMRAPR